MSDRILKASVLGDRESGHQLTAPAISLGKGHTLDFTGTSGRTAALDTELIKVAVTEDCWIEIGDATVVAAPVTSGNSGDSSFMFGGTFDYFSIQRGQQLAVIRNTTSGTMYVTEASYA